MKKTFIIEDMHCQHCKKRVTEIFKSVPVVVKVKVNLKKKTVSVLLDSVDTIDLIKKSFEDEYIIKEQ